MKLFNKHKAENPAGVPQPEAGKEKKKFKFKITLTSVLVGVLVLVAVGILGFSFHSYVKATPEFCSACHNMESHVTSYLSSDHLDNVHAQANVTCKECHSNYTLFDEASSMVKYVTGDYKDIFTKRKYDDTMCLQCHVSMEFQAVETSNLERNPHDSHYPALKCSTCHMAHTDQVNYCAQCHDNGGQRMIEEINSKSAETTESE